MVFPSLCSLSYSGRIAGLVIGLTVIHLLPGPEGSQPPADGAKPRCFSTASWSGGVFQKDSHLAEFVVTAVDESVDWLAYQFFK